MQSFPASLKLLHIHILGAALTLTSLLIITLLASPLKQSNIFLGKAGFKTNGF